MMKYHVHVYRVANKSEIDVKAKNRAEAMSKAIEKKKLNRLPIDFPDCDYVAVVFEGVSHE